MRLHKWLFWGTAILLASPVFATTYWAGFEDTIGSGSDYDYNDLVFTLSASTLTLNTPTGVWFDKASAGALNVAAGANGLSGTPFWNHSSLDGAGGNNLGWCIYGGGTCNGGVGVAPGDQYLATAAGGSVNNVSFSVNGAVTELVTLAITSATDTLGWQLTSGGAVHLFGSGVQGPVSFTPGGDFVLIATVNGGSPFASNAAASDGVSHFAFFAPPSIIPEPASVGLFGFALVAGGLALRKRAHKVIS